MGGDFVLRMLPCVLLVVTAGKAHMAVTCLIGIKKGFVLRPLPKHFYLNNRSAPGIPIASMPSPMGNGSSAPQTTRQRSGSMSSRA